MSKRQPNFTAEKVEVLLTCVESQQQILFGSFSSGLSAVVKDKNWEEVAESVSAVSGVKRSVALHLCESADLCTMIPTITEGNSKLGTAVPCYMEQDHRDQLKWLNCKECNPFRPSAVFLDELVG